MNPDDARQRMKDALDADAARARRRLTLRLLGWTVLAAAIITIVWVTRTA
jgi:hypothetical protein